MTEIAAGSCKMDYFTPITDAEIRAFIAKHNWHTAKATANPHQYLVKYEVDVTNWYRFAGHIRIHGYHMDFWGKPYTCLDVDGYRYWTCGDPLDETHILNRAKN